MIIKSPVVILSIVITSILGFLIGMVAMHLLKDEDPEVISLNNKIEAIKKAKINEVAQLQRQKEEVELENKKLEQELSNLKAGQKSPAEVQKLMDNCANLEVKCNDLKQQLSEIAKQPSAQDNNDKKIAELEEKLKTLRKANTQLKLDVSNAASADSILKKTLTDAINEGEGLQKQKDELAKQLKEKEKEYSLLSKKLDALKAGTNK